MTSNLGPRPPRGRFLQSIQGRLILLVCTLLIPTLLIQTYIYYDRFQTRRAEELQSNLEMGRAVASAFETFTMDIVHSELVMGRALIIPSLTDADRTNILTEFRADNPAIRVAFWMNPHGLVIASDQSEYIGYDLSDRSYCIEIFSGRPWFLSELHMGRQSKKPAFTITRGIRNAQGELLGIIAAGMEPESLTEVLKIERSKGAAISLLDSRGMLVYRFPHIQASWEERNWAIRAKPFREALEGRESAEWVFSAASDGKGRFIAATQIHPFGWIADGELRLGTVAIYIHSTMT